MSWFFIPGGVPAPWGACPALLQHLVLPTRWNFITQEGNNALYYLSELGGGKFMTALRRIAGTPTQGSGNRKYIPPFKVLGSDCFHQNQFVVDQRCAGERDSMEH